LAKAGEARLNDHRSAERDGENASSEAKPTRQATWPRGALWRPSAT